MGAGALWPALIFTDRTLVSLSKFARGLTALDVSSSALTDRGVLTLGQACPQLTALTFTQCGQLTSLALVYLADSASAASLTSLNVSMCHRVDDHGASYALNKCTALVTLRTAQCVGVTDRTLLYLGKRARTADDGGQGVCAMRELDLFRCPISDRGLLGLLKAKESRWEGLQLLKLGNCPRVSDEGVAAVAATCPSLRQLSLYGCTAITDRSCSGLSRHCSQPQQILSASPAPQPRRALLTLFSSLICSFSALGRAAAGVGPQPLRQRDRRWCDGPVSSCTRHCARFRCPEPISHSISPPLPVVLSVPRTALR